MAILNLILLLLLPCLAGQAQAACTSGYASANYCLAKPKFDTLDNQGKDIKSSNYQISASTMYPVQAQATTAELAYWQQKADTNLQAGKDFLNGLLLIGVNPQDNSALSSILNKPEENYETVGLLGNYTSIEAGLIQARDTFSYHLYRGYPDATTARNNLLNTLKILVNIDLMIADEYLIDALNWRIPVNMPGVADPLLSKQLDLLEKAKFYYERAVNVFVSGFSPAVGTTITISDSFDDTTFSLFDLAVERLSLTQREKTSKQLAKMMNTDPNGRTALSTIKSAYINMYLTASAAVMAQNSPVRLQQSDKFNSFDDTQAGSSLIAALNMLRNQGNIYNQGLNPLGYDNRYIPAQNFNTLYDLALINYNNAKDYETKTDRRSLFDSSLTELRNEWKNLNDGYGLTLQSLTGCKLYDPDFVECITLAGSDLFQCRTVDGLDNMENCINNSTTKTNSGNLALKYLKIKQAQLALNRAIATKDNLIQSRIDNIEVNEKKIYYINDKGISTNIAIEKYLPLLKESRTIVNETVKTNHKVKVNGKIQTKQTTIDDITRTSLSLNESLGIEVKKAQDLQAITERFEIRNVQLGTDYIEKDILRKIVMADYDIENAVLEKNSAVVDFMNSFNEKEVLVLAYKKGLEQSQQLTGDIAPLRIIKSSDIINQSEQINLSSHYAYLAAKALEYQYATPLKSSPNINDIFKAQTPNDIYKFLTSLYDFNRLRCPWGTFNGKTISVSLAFDILNLTYDALDPDGDGLTSDGKDLTVRSILPPVH